MQDKYTLPVKARKDLVGEQIIESQKIIYRNDLENLTFKEKKDEDKQIEVETNNKILRRKLDQLWQELARLDKEEKAAANADSSDTAV